MYRDERRVPWHVISEMHEGNTTGADAENVGGFVIYCTDDVDKIEFQAVAFERRHVTNSKYKRKTFKQQLRDQTDAAQAACDAINEQLARAKQLREEALGAANGNGKLGRALDEAGQAIEALTALRKTLNEGRDKAIMAENKARDKVDELRVRETADAV